MTDDSPSSRQLLASVAIPLAESLLVTYAILNIICRIPWQSTLSWKQVFLAAFLYIAVALGVHTLAVRLACKLFAVHVDLSPRTLTYGLWMSIAWVPLLVLLLKQRSLLAVAVPTLIIINAALFLRRLIAAATPQASPSVPTSTLFQQQQDPLLLRALLPTAASALALQAGLLVLLFDRPLLAGSLFAFAVALPIWLYPVKPPSAETSLNPPPSRTLRSLVTNSLIVFLFTALALVPFVARVNGRTIRSPLGVGSVNAATTSPPKPGDSGGGFSGIILLPPPPKPHPIVPPAPRDLSQAGLPKQPIVIPFDGVYWYFKQPDVRPRPDAPIVHGDPTKAKIFSSNARPLAMEARQSLGTPVQLDCCSAIHVAILNADNRPGIISVQIVFSNKSAEANPRNKADRIQPNLVLGSMVLHSSEIRPIPLNRPPVEEVLNFPIPRTARGARFDEIAVVIQPSWEHSLAGAQIAVQQFTLVP